MKIHRNFEALRAIPCKPQTKVLNRYRQIQLIFTHVVEASVLWILVKAVSKNIEPFGFYRIFTETSEKCTFSRDDFRCQKKSIKHRLFVLNFFLHANIWLSSTYTINFSLNYWTVGILWILQFQEKWIFEPTCLFYISLLENRSNLKFWRQVHLSVI